MKTLTVSSSQFHQDDSEAWAASESSPVIITDSDNPVRVLLSFEEFKKMKAEVSSPASVVTAEHKATPSKKFISLAEALAMPDGDDFDFDPPRSRELARGWDFS